MANINLVPQNQAKSQNPNRPLIRGLVVTIIVVAAVFGGLFIFSALLSGWQKTAEATKAAATKEKETYSDVSAQAQVLQKQLINISSLLNQHVYWSDFFWTLEDRTLMTVSLNSFQASTPGTVQITGIAPSYSEVAKQIAAYMGDPFFKGYNLKHAALEANADSQVQVSFSLDLNLADNVLHKTDQEIASEENRINTLLVPATTPAVTPTPTAAP